MAHWLIKSEPGKWSGKTRSRPAKRNVLERCPQSQCQAKFNAMRVGEQAFFYHSTKARRSLVSSKSSNPIIQIRRIRAANSEWLMFARSRHLKNRWASMP